jgi:hypothetical protein
MQLSLNLDITEDLQDLDVSVDTLKACQRSRRVSGALPSLTPCPFGHIYPRPVVQYSWIYPVGPWLCGHVYVGPRTVNSIIFPSFSMSYLLGTDAVNTVDWQQIVYLPALAEITPRPDGGLPRPTPFAPQSALALRRWLHSENPPLPPLAKLFTLGPGHLTSAVRTLRLRLPLLLIDLAATLVHLSVSAGCVNG